MRRLKCMIVCLSVCMALGTSMVAVSAQTKNPIQFTKKVFTVNCGDKKDMSSFIKPKKFKSKLTWKSSNKKVVTVTRKGVAKALKKGTVKITAFYGKKKAICKIKVKNKEVPKENEQPVSISASGAGVSISENWGETAKIYKIANDGIYLSLHLDNTLEAKLCFADTVTLWQNGVQTDWSALQVGQWINFDYSVANAAYPSTYYGCTRIQILK